MSTLRKHAKKACIIFLYLGIILFSIGIFISFHYSLEMIRRLYDITFPAWWESLLTFDHTEIGIDLLITVAVILIAMMIGKLYNLWKPILIAGCVYIVSLSGMIMWHYPYRFGMVELENGAVVFNRSQGPIQYDWIANDFVTALPGIILIATGIILLVRSGIERKNKTISSKVPPAVTQK